MELFVEILIVVGLLALFVLFFILNKKTKLPEGVTEDDIARCEACHNTSCKKRLNKNCEEFKNEE